MRAWTALLLLLAPTLGGCLDFLDGLGGPAYRVSRTALEEGDGWNRDGRFLVQVLGDEPVEVRITATPQSGAPLGAAGTSNATLGPVALDLPDGTWTVAYTLNGRRWETFQDVRVDGTPPRLEGLQTLGTAEGGRFTVGAGATLEAGAQVQVVDQDTGAVLGTALPTTVEGLADGLHAFDVTATDPAGNQEVWTVQVRAGTAAALPQGTHSLGIVARYTLAAQLWDLSGLGAFATPEAARAAVGGQHLGSGNAIAPDDPDVQAAVAEAVEPGQTTGEAALAIFHWMFDRLEYDESRLDSTGLLAPRDTIEAGGGVCRDLAALYVSMLRAAGIPARLVAGYLAGTVNGFHAWVEFYGGEGHGPSPWVPVDVSPIDGGYDAPRMMQAFGIRLPALLRLREITPAQEQGDWSSASTLSYSYPAGSAAPQVRFEERLAVEFREERVLCVDPESLARKVASSQAACGTGYPMYFPGFVARAQQVLDYGIDVASAADGTTLTVALGYPQPAQAPDEVQFVHYGAAFSRNEARGRLEAEREY